MISLWNNAEKLGNLAQVALAVTAIVALGLAYLQIRFAQLSQRETTAKEIYRDYLRLAFEYPMLASPDDNNQKIIQDYKYRWFVAVMLNACEEILASSRNDPAWQEVVLAEMEYHKSYLNSKYFLANDEDRGWTLYSTQLKKLFEERFSLTAKRGH